MSAATVTVFVLVYGLAFWLGLYLIGRDPRSPRLLLTGFGLVAYALAVACDLLIDGAPQQLTPALARTRWPLLLLPALFWTGTLVWLLPEETRYRTRLARIWTVAAPAVMVLILAVSFGTDLVVAPVGEVSGGALPTAFGVAVLAPMLMLGCLVWRSLRRNRAGSATPVAGVLAVFTLFFGLSTVLILFPSGLLPRSWTVVGMGIDVVSLGLAISYFDAFEGGEALLPDMVRSFDTALLAALVFGGQVALVAWLSAGTGWPMLVLILTVVGSAVAVTTLSDRLASALDRLALSRMPGVRQARSELRTTARALQRQDPALDPLELDEGEFVRLTRRALSNFGDLPRLSASPLINLPLVRLRLTERGARDDHLERAAELKAVLAESIARLKPRTAADFGTSDEWRYYNALYFPYVAGLRPYSSRSRAYPKDPAAREALEWFRTAVPERTLYNWQTAAARLVARDLRARNGPPAE